MALKSRPVTVEMRFLHLPFGALSNISMQDISQGSANHAFSQQVKLLPTFHTTAATKLFVV